MLCSIWDTSSRSSLISIWYSALVSGSVQLLTCDSNLFYCELNKVKITDGLKPYSRDLLVLNCVFAFLIKIRVPKHMKIETLFSLIQKVKVTSQDSLGIALLYLEMCTCSTVCMNSNPLPMSLTAHLLLSFVWLCFNMLKKLIQHVISE